MTKKQRALFCVEALEKEYPDAICSLTASNPLELLIATRLSAQCTDARVNLVTPALFKKYPTLESYCEAEIEDIENIIHSCGFYRAKAKNIKDSCALIVENYGGKVPADREVLLTFPGVGRKIANLLLGDIYGIPGIVADTHLICIGGRLGAYPVEMKDPHKVEKILDLYVEPEEQSDFCHRAVQFGRDYCTARAPKCDRCPLGDICPFAQAEN